MLQKAKPKLKKYQTKNKKKIKKNLKNQKQIEEPKI
jgi:hypothetical protein